MQGYVVFGLLKLVSTAPAAEAQEAGPFAGGVSGRMSKEMPSEPTGL